MNAFLSVMNSFNSLDATCVLKREKLEILQVNMGNLCNQHCSHCHVDASPQGDKIMSRDVVNDIIAFLSKNKGLILDITGGAAELNPHLDYFIVKAKPFVKEIILRSNLTVFFEDGKDYLTGFFKENGIHLICSLPCYRKENVETQRGNGVFQKSLNALRQLNKLGYAIKEDLKLDLVYNPHGAYLPPRQDELEKEYKENLGRDYAIKFNRLITITNAPIKRFKNYLDANGEYERYIDILKDNFNPQVAENIMCRTLLSVGYDGRLYDCDFNQSLGWDIKDVKGDFLTIDKLDLKDLDGKDIMVGEHCLSCTAGYGSSCQGALVKEERTKEAVKTYYGKVLKSNKDLKTNACCTTDSNSLFQRDILDKIHPQIMDKFYGCGSPIPPVLDGCTVLDLGCGTGRDVYMVSALVGENGRSIGVDMTDEQLEVANKHKEIQMKRFGFKRCNVEFKKGYIEDLKEIYIADNSIDVVISNCVINLSPDKKSVFSEIFRVLKLGGELYFSDIFAGRRIPEQLKNDPVLYGECLAGALYIEDFRRILREVGCLDYRVVSQIKLKLNDTEFMQKIGMIDFYSMTVRAFKLDDLEDICEDYGQVAIYKGTIPGNPHQFLLDDHHIFITNKPMPVCGNTASMLSKTRLGKHFKIIGNRSTHYGPFNCAPSAEKIKSGDTSGGSCC